MRIPRSAAVVVALGAAGASAAQPPPGWIVSAHFASTSVGGGGAGGLFLVHPRDSARPHIAVANLPRDLTGVASPPFDEGASCVAVLPDGDLLVGETAPSGATLEVWRLRLQFSTASGGWTASRVAVHAIGPVGVLPSEVTGIVPLPDGRVLLSLYRSIADLASLDLATGSITPILTGSLGGGIANALAVDPSGSVCYLGVWNGLTGGRVWRMSLTPPGAAAPLSPPLPGGIYAITVDSTGSIIVGTNGSTGNSPWGTPPNLHRVDPTTGAVTDLYVTERGVRNALTIEANTDRIVTVGGGGSTIRIEDGTGGLLFLANGMAAGWGVPAGLAILPALEEYARAAVGNPPYRWQVTPNPGGIPTVGNAAFTLTLHAGNAPLASVLALAASATPPTPLPGGFIAVIGLNPLPVVVPLAIQQRANAIGLPIPPAPALAGRSVFGQSFHIDASGAVSGPGVRLSIL